MFNELGLGPVLLKTVSILGFEKPTPIQSAAIPHVLEGRDLMGLAQTGTGKTAAFGLPLVQNLLDENIKPQAKSVRALILAPTRELVTQITDNLRAYVKGTRLRVHLVTGGVSINTQSRKLSGGTDILVATPGRLLDLTERRALRLDQTTNLVLDEADQMLDIGFIHSLRKIAKLLKAERQTLLFSATMSGQIEDLSKTFLKDPVRVETAPAGRAADKIEQFVHFVSGNAKTELLKKCLSEREDDIAVVFARTKHGAEKLMKHLVSCGFKAGSVHGNKTQSQRDRAIKALRSGEISILVATDVAARGIDIPGVTHVYNFNLPEVPENYVHRIGRTARAGADGVAVTFCAPDEVKLLRSVEKLMDLKIQVASGEEPANHTRSRRTPDKKAPRHKKPFHKRTRARPQAEAGTAGEPPKSAQSKHKPKRNPSKAKNRHAKTPPKQHAANQNHWQSSQAAS